MPHLPGRRGGRSRSVVGADERRRLAEHRRSAILPLPILKPAIPIFPRARYHSYLKVTSVSAPIVVPISAKCQLTIIAEQFNYTQPPAGQHKGTFPTAPSRTVTLRLSKVAAPFPFSLTGGPFYEGRLFEGGVDKGSGHARVGLEVLPPRHARDRHADGRRPPDPVPDGAGGTEFFDTVFAKIGWQLTVVAGSAERPGAGRRRRRPTAGPPRTCTR